MSVAACRALWIALPLVAGCAAGPGYEVIATRPAPGPVGVAQLYPAATGEWTYLVTQGDDAGTTIGRRRGPTELHGGTWVDDHGGERSEYLRIDDAGNLVMPAVVAHEDRAITFFDPPLIIAYREQPPRRRLLQTVNMRVMDAKDIRQLRDAGTARRQVEYLGDELIRTPLGKHWTKRIQVSFEADLRLAKATNHSTFWLIPGVGPAVELRKEVITVLKVPVRRSEQTLVLMASPIPLAPEK